MKTHLFYYSFLQQSKLPGTLVATAAPMSEFLQNLCLLIEDNIDDSFLSVGFLARRMAMSKSTLNRRLAAFIGLSANEIIKQYRLQKASMLLVEGKNVSETAYMTGFETPSYFIQCFKEFYKITPKVFAKNNCLFSNNKQERA